ncbi:MAG TPA: phosphotransferase [Planctomicrobium sp.]|nr:phosphotransferase [Planctomicrobium sp.]
MNVTFDNATTVSHGRRHVYYWKCDRPAAFHGTQKERETNAIEPQLHRLLAAKFPEHSIRLRDGGGQGNHLTWIAEIGNATYFVRVENGPERDDHLEVESFIIESVRHYGVPTPRVHLVDIQRDEVSFAWQVMDCVPVPDLNVAFKKGELNSVDVSYEIGCAIARWQAVPVSGFGHFDPQRLRDSGELHGYHSHYEDYFTLNWKRHLNFLEQRQFLLRHEVREIDETVSQARDLLSLTEGCLVHKDLAFWNILGDQNGIQAYIDWDDAVSADEMDDLSLLGCFHDGPVIAGAMKGYQSIKSLPDNFGGRFWLHLLRNMIVKSVIRVGAGYFDRTDGFFLIAPGLTGADLIRQTRSRIFRVLDGLRSNEHPEAL